MNLAENVNNLEQEIATSGNRQNDITSDVMQGGDYISDDPSIMYCILKRGYMFDEFLNFVKSSKIDVQAHKIQVKVMNEQGEDSGGVFRDCLSEFWKTFYQRHTH